MRHFDGKNMAHYANVAAILVKYFLIQILTSRLTHG